jgi:hypothetical protein
MDFEALLLGGQCKRAVRWRLQMARPSDLHGVRKSGYRLQCAIKCQWQPEMLQPLADRASPSTGRHRHGDRTEHSGCSVRPDHAQVAVDGRASASVAAARAAGDWNANLNLTAAAWPGPPLAARLARATPGRAIPGRLAHQARSRVQLLGGWRWPGAAAGPIFKFGLVKVPGPRRRPQRTRRIGRGGDSEG